MSNLFFHATSDMLKYLRIKKCKDILYFVNTDIWNRAVNIDIWYRAVILLFNNVNALQVKYWTNTYCYPPYKYTIYYEIIYLRFGIKMLTNKKKKWVSKWNKIGKILVIVQAG